MLYTIPPLAEVTNTDIKSVEVRNFSTSSFSAQELAQLALAIKSGKDSKVDISKFENAAFKSFLNRRIGDNSLSLMVCKGCHGG